ncbi:MAG: YaiI/YqxD family protein [bacterium]|nr:YaiI/YqxD family protein [bacterium]
MPNIFVDADACPVKQEVYRVAGRHALRVTLVSNSWMRTPPEDWIELVVVDGGLDVADDWIAEHVREDDVVVTADIPLASRCLEKRALVLGPTGRVFTEDMIGEALATREILSQLRDVGVVTGGPAPFERRDRSRFLQNLDEAIRTVSRRKKTRST